LEEEKMSKEEMDMKAEWKERRSKENFAEAAEQPDQDFKKLMLRQLNLNTKEVEKHADAKQLNYIMKAETNEVGEVVKMLGKTAQMMKTSKLLKEEVGEVVTKANPEAREKFNKCDNSFPHEPGADSEQSKIKEVMEIDPWNHWTRWRRCGAAKRFPRLSKNIDMKAEEVEAQTPNKEEKTKFSHPEMKVEKVLFTAEQCRLLAEVEAWGEEDAEPGLHVEVLPASKDLLAEVEAWGHEDAEADILESFESKQEAEVKLAAHTTKGEAVERRLPRLEKVDSNNNKTDVEAEKSASNQLEEEEELKKEQGGELPLIINKQKLVEVSLSKMVEMTLMHALKAEAEQVSYMEQKLMKEELLEFCKQCLEVEECEKEEHEALPLLVDKQAG